MGEDLLNVELTELSSKFVKPKSTPEDGDFSCRFVRLDTVTHTPPKCIKAGETYRFASRSWNFHSLVDRGRHERRCGVW